MTKTLLQQFEDEKGRHHVQQLLAEHDRLRSEAKTQIESLTAAGDLMAAAELQAALDRSGGPIAARPNPSSPWRGTGALRGAVERLEGEASEIRLAAIT